MIGSVDLSIAFPGQLVLALLLILSIWMWSLILLKWLQFRWLRSNESPLDLCLQRFQQGQSVEGWQGEIWRQGQQAGASGAMDRKALIDIGEQLANRLGGSVRTILVLAQTAPLLGLIGTVMGMITTFDVIHLLGNGNLQEMSRGISQALTTTQAGLVVAIPGLVVGSLLRRQAERLGDRIEAFAIAVGRSVSLEAV